MPWKPQPLLFSEMETYLQVSCSWAALYLKLISLTKVTHLPTMVGAALQMETEKKVRELIHQQRADCVLKGCSFG